MKDLPEGWTTCKLGDLIDYGKTEKVEAHQIKPNDWVLELEDIEKGTSKVLQRVSFGERQSKSTKNRFKPGDVLYGKLRPYLSKVVRADAPGLCTTEILPLRPPPEVHAGYLFHWLKHPQFLDYVNAVSHGLNMPRLGTEAGRAAPFVLAPRAEQQRIADKLDTLLARVDACRERLDRVPGTLKRFKQSVLAAAVSGQLTEDWRFSQGQLVVAEAFLANRLPAGAEPDFKLEVPTNWCLLRARDVVNPHADIVYGILQPGPKLTAGVPYVQITDIVAGHIKVEDLSFTSSQIADNYRRSSINAGDVLLGIIRATKVAVVPAELDGANISRSVARLRPREGVLPAFLAIALEAPAVQNWLRAQHRGMDMPVLNLSEVRQAPIPIAPEEEQAEIVRRVQSLFALADEIETKWKVARAQVEGLTPALLVKAFRGELVPQDPNDEPAMVLIERINAVKAQSIPRPNRKTQSRRSDLKTASDEPLMKVIDQMDKAEFTFEELRQQSNRGYESLKNELFALLAEKKSGVEQYFDEIDRSMKLRRVSK